MKKIQKYTVKLSEFTFTSLSWLLSHRLDQKYRAFANFAWV